MSNHPDRVADLVLDGSRSVRMSSRTQYLLMTANPPSTAATLKIF
jgi:hypothetical protein